MNRRIPVAVVTILIVVVGVAVVVIGGSGPQVRERAEIAPGVRALILDGGVEAIELADGTRNELTAAVYLPTTWTGPRTAVLIQHGGHTVCARPDDSWPCADPADRTPSYLGYDRLAAALVTSGLVVVSISANATIGRAEVTPFPEIVATYHDLLRQAATGDGPLGAELDGRLDLRSLALIGHSRGGDAVAQYVSGDQSARPVPVTATVLLAPVPAVDAHETRTLPTVTVPTLVLAGTCDGDAGSNWTDFAGTAGDKVEVESVIGANHNFWNTVWTPGTGVADAIDDADELVDTDPACAPGSPTRLSADQQLAIADEVVPRFLLAHL